MYKWAVTLTYSRLKNIGEKYMTGKEGNFVISKTCLKSAFSCYVQNFICLIHRIYMAYTT